MDKPKSYPKNFKPMTDWYKVRICIENVLEFMRNKEENIKQYSLFEFWEYIQLKIADEWKDI